MPDKMSAEQRSYVMSRIKSKDTKPEVAVRKALHRLGFRFRLHKRGLPGRPDIVLARHRTIIFVHGCFWHGHACLKGRRPASRQDYWNPKLDRNLARDAEAQAKLEAMGWRVHVLWECELKKRDELPAMLQTLMAA